MKTIFLICYVQKKIKTQTGKIFTIRSNNFWESKIFTITLQTRTAFSYTSVHQ